MNKNWISVHIFYSANPTPLLVECLTPLVRQLRERGLIAGYFFIRYWLGGPHIRLRLLLSETSSEAEIKGVLEPAVGAFLARRPALFEVDNTRLKSYYRNLYEAEYGTEDYLARYGENGEIPAYDNNTFHYIAYEPELGRYGGEAGLALAEQHFEVSSDIVLKLSSETNVHVRSIVMGHAVQLMLQLCYGFFGGDEQVSDFLRRYIVFWQDFYGKDRSNLHPIYDRKYTHIAAKLQQRIREVRSFIQQGPDENGTEIERKWATHVGKLRQSLVSLLETDRLELPAAMPRQEGPMLGYLLTSYVHMTNNRIGVSILDESYLSYLILRGIADAGSDAVREATRGDFV